MEVRPGLVSEALILDLLGPTVVTGGKVVKIGSIDGPFKVLSVDG